MGRRQLEDQLPVAGGRGERDEVKDYGTDGWRRYSYYYLLGQSHDRIRISADGQNHWVPLPSGRAAAVLVISAILVLVVQVGVWMLLMTSRRGVDRPTVIGTTTVDLDYATYEGLRFSNGVNAFLGMRYAAPPVGDLRWRAPVEPARTETGSVERATTFPPICLGIGAAYPAEGQSEDCLFANVWAPANATETSKLPVWVFIQGGGYIANTNANVDGGEAVQRSGHNIVVVSLNYRVGLWGFLASERVRDDGALNAGLLDQRMLMKWVKKHIASFGGDPDHVVIHGASAGAGSLAMHLTAYGGRNDELFVGGMAESLFFPAQPFVGELEYQFDRVVSQTGCGSAALADQMACLRSKDVSLLQAANFAQAFPGRTGPPMPPFYWTPCVDGDFLRDLPYRLFERGQFVRVPMVFGTSTDEGSVFAANAATPSDIAHFFRNNYPLLTADDTSAILAHYAQLPPVPAHEPWFPTASQAYGEATFICPQHNILHYLHQHSQPRSTNTTTTTAAATTTTTPATTTPKLYAYHFSVQDAENSALGLGTPHLFDLPAIFGPDSAGGPARASYRTYNAHIVPLMMGYYTSFVRALDPNAYRMVEGEATPRWEEWGGAPGGKVGRRMVIETSGARMEGTDERERDRCEFWLGLGVGRMRQR